MRLETRHAILLKRHKTQCSLSEDIRDARAFLKKGAKWLIASELARDGTKEIFKKFPR